MIDDIEKALKWGKLGLELVTNIFAALKAGKDLKDVRVSDVMPEQSQIEMAALAADEKARLKFGEAP